MSGRLPLGGRHALFKLSIIKPEMLKRDVRFARFAETRNKHLHGFGRTMLQRLVNGLHGLVVDGILAEIGSEEGDGTRAMLGKAMFEDYRWASEQRGLARTA